METAVEPPNLLEFEEEDLLSGICPEDLSFSLNSSASIVNTSQTPALPPSHSADMEQGQALNFIPDSPPPRSLREEAGTLLGLPETVWSLMEELRGIQSLYGQWRCVTVDAVHVTVILCRMARKMPLSSSCAGWWQLAVQSAHQWRQDASGRDPYPQTAATERERCPLCLALCLHCTGKGMINYSGGPL